MLIKCKAKEHRICDYLVCLCVFGAHANHKSPFFSTRETSIVSWRKRLCRWMPSSFNTLSLLWINATEFNLKDLPASCQCVRSVTNEQQTFFLLLSFHHHLVCCYANNANAFPFLLGCKQQATHFFLVTLLLLLLVLLLLLSHTTQLYTMSSLLCKNFTPFACAKTIITMMSCAFSYTKQRHQHQHHFHGMPSGNHNNNNNENILVEKVIKATMSVILASFRIRMLLKNTD